MARFQPRLQTVARLREAQRDALRRRLGEAQQAEQVLLSQRAQTEEEARELLEYRRETIEERGCDIQSLLATQRYEAALRVKLQAVGDDLQKVRQEINLRQAAAAEAQREVRVIELLNDRARERHQREEQRREDRSLDEFASRSHQTQQTDKETTS